MILLAALVGFGCVTLAVYIYYPDHLVTVLLVTGVTVLLALSVAARKRINEKGGAGLWIRGLGLRSRALTKKSEVRKADKLARLAAAADKVHRQRQRESDKKKQAVLGREVVKIKAAVADLAKSYSSYPFVDFHFMDNGICFCVTDDQPYPHQDIYALYADVPDHRRFRRKVSYCVRKGRGTTVPKVYRRTRGFFADVS